MRMSSTFGKAGIVAATLGAATLVGLAGVQAQEATVGFMSSNDQSCGPFPQKNAAAFGFWDDLGLKVNFLSSATTVPFVAFLQNGDADVVMLDSAQVLQAADSGLPIKVVYEAYQFAPDGIVVVEDSPIKGLDDLHDVTVGMASDRDLITTVIALASVGKTLESANIKSVVVGDSGPVMAAALRDKTIDAFAGGSTDRAGIEAAGVKFRNITPPEVSRNPGNSMAVWGPTIEEKRPQITAFLKGWAMAQMAGALDTKLTAAACRTMVPEDFEHVDVGTRMIDNQVYNMQLRRTQEWGELQPEVWAAIQPPYLTQKEITKEIDPSTFLDSSFIAAANDFTTEDVKKKIYAWRDANPDKLLP